MPAKRSRRWLRNKAAEAVTVLELGDALDVNDTGAHYTGHCSLIDSPECLTIVHQAPERVGRSTVSRAAKRLEQAVEDLWNHLIEGPHPYVYLDATCLDACWARKVENVSALRLITAVAPRTTEAWGSRRYCDLSLLSPKEVAQAS